MAIEVRGVDKSFGEKRVLSGFSAEFPDGVTAITGPSGCGKTTLLRIISGLEKPDAGEVLTDGRPGTARVAFVFSEPRLFPNCGALDNAAISFSRGIKRGREKAAGFLDALGMSDAFHLRPSELSAGMAQRVQIARALTALSEGVRILLLDEPFRGLDAATKEKTAGLILRETTGKTVLFVTHEREEIPLLNSVSELAMGNNTTV